MTIEKISVDGHYVWVDKDADINENDFILTKDNRVIEVSYLLSKDLEQASKIIAASPELNLKHVPSYARYKALEYSKPIEKKVEDESSYDWCLGAYQGFEEGYKAAEKELYTEDDVRKAIDMARLIKEDGSVEDSFTAEDISGCTEVCTYGWGNRHSEEEIIEQLKQGKL